MEWMKRHSKCPQCHEPYVPARGFVDCRDPDDSLFCFHCVQHGILRPAGVGWKRNRVGAITMKGVLAMVGSRSVPVLSAREEGDYRRPTRRVNEANRRVEIDFTCL